jgi:hypothetical protein
VKGAVPPFFRRRLWYAIAGAGLFMTTACAEGARRPDYDAWHQAISALSLGPDGWIQMLAFFGFGATILSTVQIWRRILTGGKGAAAFPVLTALTGASLIFCGFVPQDPAPGYDPMGLALTAPTLRGLAHLAGAGVAALSSVVGLLVMAARFRGDPAWRGWSWYSVVMAAVMAGCVVVYGIWSTAPTGYAGTFERIALLVVPVWGWTFLRRLGAGAPFMHTEPPTLR